LIITEISTQIFVCIDESQNLAFIDVENAVFKFFFIFYNIYSAEKSLWSLNKQQKSVSKLLQQILIAFVLNTQKYRSTIWQ
jgi:hypothetical protein